MNSWFVKKIPIAKKKGLNGRLFDKTRYPIRFISSEFKFDASAYLKATVIAYSKPSENVIFGDQIGILIKDSGKKPNLVNLILQGRDIIEEFPADAVGSTIYILEGDVQLNTFQTSQYPPSDVKEEDISKYCVCVRPAHGESICMVLKNIDSMKPIDLDELDEPLLASSVELVGLPKQAVLEVLQKIPQKRRHGEIDREGLIKRVTSSSKPSVILLECSDDDFGIENMDTSEGVISVGGNERGGPVSGPLEEEEQREGRKHVVSEDKGKKKKKFSRSTGVDVDQVIELPRRSARLVSHVATTAHVDKEGGLSGGGRDGEGGLSDRGKDGEVGVSDRGREGEGGVSDGGKDGEGGVSDGGREGEVGVSDRGREGEGGVSDRGRDVEGGVSDGGRDVEGGVSDRGRDGEGGVSDRGKDGEGGVSDRGREGEGGVSDRGRDGEGGVSDGGKSNKGSSGQGSASAKEKDSCKVSGKGTPLKGGRSRKEEYSYLKLNQLRVGMRRINVYGVVKFFHPPRQSHGNDKFASFRIVDESLPGNQDIQCTLFHSNIDCLPNITSVGTIIRLHRVNVTEYQGAIQCGGTKMSSHLLFDGRKDHPVVPRTGSSDFTYCEQDEKRVLELKDWSCQQPFLNANMRMCTLDKVVSGLYFDMVCQVVSVCVVPAKEYGVVKVWDGTKPNLKVKEAERYGTLTQSDQVLEEVVYDYLVDVILYNQHSNVCNSILPGEYIRLSNTHAACYQTGGGDTEVVDLCIHRGGSHHGSGAAVLSISNPDVITLKERLKEVLDERRDMLCEEDDKQMRPLQSSLTTCMLALKLSTIAEVKASEKIPFMYKMRVKFQRFDAPDIESLIKLVCSNCLKSDFKLKSSDVSSESTCVSQAESTSVTAEQSFTDEDVCPECLKNGRNSQLKYRYRMIMEVSDATDMLQIVVADDPAEEFLPGLPPANLYTEQAAGKLLSERLSQMTAGESLFESPTSLSRRPYLECCVRKYYLQNTAYGKKHGLVDYRLELTVLE